MVIGRVDMKIDENNRPLIPPEEDLRDAGYSAVRAGLSMIPIVGGADHILESAYPELKNRRDFYDQIWKDLFQKGLVNCDSLHGMMTGRGIFEKRTTDLGDKFLGFIVNPN